MHDCTYLIPAYNRPDRLKRHLQYLAHAGWKGPVLVADSSAKEHGRAHEETIRSCKPELSIEHMTVDPADLMYTKLSRAAASVRTPFIALCADDDFLVPSSVERALSFLRTHPDHALATGRTIGISSTRDHTMLTLERRRAISGETPEARLQDLLGNFVSILWGVYRTGACVAAIGGAEKHTAQSDAGGFAYRFSELYAACETVLEGKVAMVPKLLHIREAPGTHELYSEKIFGWPAIFAHEEFPAHYRAFRDGLAGSLRARRGLTAEQANTIVDNAFERYKQNILTPPRAGAAQKLRDIVATQWFRILLGAKEPSEYFSYELRAPLRTLRRLVSPEWRALRDVRKFLHERSS